MSGLLDPYLKLSRARTHLESLDSQLKTFEKSQPYTITRYDDIEKQRHVLRTQLAEVPDLIPLTVGEVLYCMRCSLDQLVWSLAKRCGGIVNPDHTQFPILRIDDTNTRRRFDSQTLGVPDAAKAEIRSFQPYHRKTGFNAHPLWRLNALCNTDKHRRIPANGSEMTLHFPRELQEFITLEEFDDYGIQSVPLAMKDKFTFDPRITFKVNFGWGFGPPDPDSLSESRDGLWEIYNFIRDTVLPRFVRFLP